MTLSELYEKGEAAIRAKDIGFLLDAVETEFVLHHDRCILDRFTFRQCAIDAEEADTACQVLGVQFSTPVIMSAITMPIPAIVENGLMETALGLKAAGSLMWTGTPIPKDLKDFVEAGVPLAANVKPLKDRRQMFAAIEEIQDAGVTWVGIEIDSGQGTKVKDKPMAFDCTPLAFNELKEIRNKVSRPLIFKGILSSLDARKSVDAGADAIMVSNHGGHTLDYLPHPFQVMDEIVSTVKKDLTVMVDGGFRRGSDILKGLAFGADLVGLGRPILFGLAAGQRNGVREVVEEITAELKRLMTMVGASKPGMVDRDVLIEDTG